MADPLVEELKRTRPSAGGLPPVSDGTGVARDPLAESLSRGAAGPPAPTLTRSESIGAQVGQRDIPPGGMENIPARTLMEAADTKLEKLAAFKKFFPEGELAFLPRSPIEGKAGDPVLVFRANPSEPFKEVDPPFLEDLSGGEIITDVIEFFANDIGAIAGEVAATAGKVPVPQARGTALAARAIQLVPQLVKLAAGAFAGELGQEAAERAIIPGESDEPIETVVRRAQGQATIGVVGGVVLDKLGRPIVNLARGAGLVGLRTGAQRAMQAAERLGIQQLPATMVSDSPILQRMGRQAAALTVTLNRYVESLENQTFRAAQKLRRQTRGDTVNIGQIVQAEAAERADIERILVNEIGLKPGTFADAGPAIKEAIADYELSSGGRVTLAYNAAREIETPDFNLQPAFDMATEVKAIAEEMGPEGAAVRKLADDILNVRTAGVDETAVKSLLAQAEEAGDEPLAAALRQTLQQDPARIGQKVINLPGGEQKILSSTELLRFLRSQAFDLMTPAPGDIRRMPQAQAARLFGSLNEVLKNPRNTDAAFVGAWQKANTMAAKRFETLEKSIVVAALKTDTPSEVAARLTNFAHPSNVENLALVKRIVPTEKFQELQKLALADLLRDPFTITSRLKQAQPEVLKGLFSPAELKSLVKAGKSFDDLARTGLPKALESQTRMTTLVANLAESQSTRGIDTLFDLVQKNGGKDSPLGRTVRAGIIDTIVGHSGVFERGVDRIDFKKLRAELNKFGGTGALRFLKSSDIRSLNDLLRVQDLLRLTPDAGTSLQAASAVAGLRTLEATAISTIFENLGVGKLVTTPAGINFLVGAAGKQKIASSQIPNVVGAIAAQLATDAEAVGQLTEDIVEALSEFVTEQIPETAPESIGP